MTRDRDVMLVEACLSGDSAAFGALVDRYESTLFNVALQITGTREDAMDATQSAFVKAYEKLHTFDRSRRFFSWLYRIAINEALNHTRHRGRESNLEGDVPAWSTDPEQAVGASETWAEVMRAVARLGIEHRSVVVLRHLQGMTYREIAGILGISEKKVKSRLFEGRRQIREMLAERGVLR